MQPWPRQPWLWFRTRASVGRTNNVLNSLQTKTICPTYACTTPGWLYPLSSRSPYARILPACGEKYTVGLFSLINYFCQNTKRADCLRALRAPGSIPNHLELACFLVHHVKNNALVRSFSSAGQPSAVRRAFMTVYVAAPNGRCHGSGQNRTPLKLATKTTRLVVEKAVG